MAAAPIGPDRLPEKAQIAQRETTPSREQEEFGMAVRFAGPLGGPLNGTNSDDVLWGAGGQDIISGLGGKDYLYGGSNNDVLDGGSGTDYLRGDGGNDVLFGGSGTDYLKGGTGSDTLQGGTGPDVLNGGSGTDYFVFGAADGTNTDTIEDFEVGIDRLKLGDGLQVIQDFRQDINFDGDRDTVLVLSNQATIVLLDIGTDQDWTLGAGNVLLA
jgi:Ca2+-binding RTX toxin-like protein